MPERRRSVGKIVLRSSVFGILAAFLFLAVLDFTVKSSAEQTTIKWRNVMDQAAGPPTEEELSPHIGGSPTTQEAGDGLPSVYRWAGVFRVYEVAVEWEAGGSQGNRAARRISGPISYWRFSR